MRPANGGNRLEPSLWVRQNDLQANGDGVATFAGETFASALIYPVLNAGTSFESLRVKRGPVARRALNWRSK
ncbi:hypothetical protein CSC82_08630 [Rhodobacteraceae bacterium 4F10]|nr:hypothetical protein CSC82_08630 [Rhodobacteraceae bacterium 4F10]